MLWEGDGREGIKRRRDFVCVCSPLLFVLSKDKGKALVKKNVGRYLLSFQNNNKKKFSGKNSFRDFLSSKTK